MDIDPVDKNADGSFDQENTVQNNKKRQLYDNNLFFNDESAQYGKAKRRRQNALLERGDAIAEKASDQGMRDMIGNREKMLGSSIAIDEPPVKYQRVQDLHQNV